MELTQWTPFARKESWPFLRSSSGPGRICFRVHRHPPPSLSSADRTSIRFCRPGACACVGRQPTFYRWCQRQHSSPATAVESFLRAPRVSPLASTAMSWLYRITSVPGSRNEPGTVQSHLKLERTTGKNRGLACTFQPTSFAINGTSFNRSLTCAHETTMHAWHVHQCGSEARPDSWSVAAAHKRI